MATPTDNSFPWAQNSVRWSPDERKFPLSHLQRRSALYAFAWTACGLLATVLPLTSAVRNLLDHGWRWGEVLLHLPFLMTGSLLFLYGLSRFYSHRLYTLRRDEIECDEVEFLDRRHWKESIRRYEGVLRDIRFYGGGRAGRSRTYYEITLQHPDPRKCVVLYRTYSWRHVDAEWRRLCHLFGLAGLERGEKGLVKHALRDLDRRAAERAREAEAWLKPESFKLGPKATLIREGERFVVRLRRQEIHFSYAGVEMVRLTAFGPRPVLQLPAERITNILLKRRGICIEAGIESLTFGGALPLADQEQIRDMIVVVLAFGPAKLQLAG